MREGACVCACVRVYTHTRHSDCSLPLPRFLVYACLLSRVLSLASFHSCPLAAPCHPFPHPFGPYPLPHPFPGLFLPFLHNRGLSLGRKWQPHQHVWDTVVHQATLGQASGAPGPLFSFSPLAHQATLRLASRASFRLFYPLILPHYSTPLFYLVPEAPYPLALSPASMCGVVLRIKVLFAKRDNALVQFESADQAERARLTLSGCPLWGRKITVLSSKHPSIQVLSRSLSLSLSLSRSLAQVFPFFLSFPHSLSSSISLSLTHSLPPFLMCLIQPLHRPTVTSSPATCSVPDHTSAVSPYDPAPPLSSVV